MHIPDNYLSPQTCAVMTAVMIPVWGISVRRVRSCLWNEENACGGTNDGRSAIGGQAPGAGKQLPMLGVAAAFSFLGMMFNIPLPGGTTGHAVGATLLALLVGPHGACISISVALLLQALLFGDGGVLAYGANCFNMAFVMPFVGYGVYRLLAGKRESRKQESEGPGSKGRLGSEKTGSEKTGSEETGRKQKGSERRRLAAAGIGAYVGLNAGALCAAIEFGIQPMLFRDASGAASYCPYPLSVSVPAMMAGHLTVFGLAEVVYTLMVYAFLTRTAGIRAAASSGTMPSAQGQGRADVLLALLAILTPLGLLAEGTAWGEWSADEIASTGAGYTPSGMASGFSFEALLPDYSLGGMPQAVGYLLSAVLGVAILLILFKLAAGFRAGKEKRH